MRGGFGFAAALAVAVLAAQPAVADAPAFNWTSFYLGVSGGGGIGTTKHTNAANGATSGSDSGMNGGILGGTYGFNWLIAPSWLVGIEGDFSWALLQDRFPHPGNDFCDGSGCITDLHWLGTDRLRFGYRTDDDWLFYATGGVAYGDVRAHILGCCTDETRTRFGYTAGGGVETSIAPQLSLKLEYLFVDLGNEVNYHGSVGGDGEKVLVRANVFRVGINYELGGP